MVDVIELQAQLEKLALELRSEKEKNAKLLEENVAIKAQTTKVVSEMEKEEELIANALMRKIETMNLEKNKLLVQIDQEEEHISNALQKKLDEVMREKVQLERQLESETEFVGNRLQRQVDQLAREKKTLAKERERLREKIQRLHGEGEKLRREKVAIEHSLETEEENIVNKLQAQIQKLLQQNVLLERKLNRLQGGNFAATSDSEQSEDGYSSTYSARAAYLSSSPRSTRSGTSTTRDGSVGPSGSRGAGHGSRGDFITSWQRGAYAAHSKENSSSHNTNNNNNNNNTLSNNSIEREREVRRKKRERESFNKIVFYNTVLKTSFHSRFPHIFLSLSVSVPTDSLQRAHVTLSISDIFISIHQSRRTQATTSAVDIIEKNCSHTYRNGFQRERRRRNRKRVRFVNLRVRSKHARKARSVPGGAHKRGEESVRGRDVRDGGRVDRPGGYRRVCV